MSRERVVIVGGGLAGLALACHAARAGRACVVLEKGREPGGRAWSDEHEGYHLNRGIHALYAGGAASEGLKELGIEVSGARATRIDVLRDGALHRSPVDPLRLLATRLFTAGEKVELMRAFAAVPRADPARWATRSAQDWIDAHARRPAVRRFLMANARTFAYTAALDLVSADVFLRKLQLALRHPVLYLHGGWRTLVQALRDAAERAGAEVRTDATVASLDVSGDRALGVRLATGERVEADHVALALPPRDAKRLAPQLAPIVDPLVPAQVACLDLALSRLPRPEHGVVQSLDEPVFLAAQSLYARVAPPGGAVVHVLKPLDPRAATDPRGDEAAMERLLDAAQPGWRDVVVKRRFLPRMDAVGMLPTAATGGYAARPGVRVPGLANVLVAGDWVGPGFLADACFASAKAAAGAIAAAPAPAAAPRAKA